MRTAPIIAPSVRLRPATFPATRAAVPNFRKEETLLTASILTVFGATMTQRIGVAEPFRRRWHLI